jgi:hypothetical protein
MLEAGVPVGGQVMTKTRLFAMSTLLAACSAPHAGHSTVTLAPSPLSDVVTSRPAPATVDAASSVLAWSDTFASDVRTRSNGSVCDTSVAIEPALRAAGSTPDEPVDITARTLIVHLWEPLGNIPEQELTAEHPGGAIVGMELTLYGLLLPTRKLRWFNATRQQANQPHDQSGDLDIPLDAIPKTPFAGSARC